MKKIYLLDAYALIYRGYYALFNNSRLNSKGMDTSAVFGFLNIFDEILQRIGEEDHVAVVFDPKGPTFRHKMYPEYKAQREVTPEPIALGIPYIKEIIKAQGVTIYEVPEYEADDVIGTIAHRVTMEDPDTIAYMITPDKDYGQLVSDRVRIFKPEKGAIYKELGPEEVAEQFGLRSHTQMTDFLALMGDSSDNVPGCPGVGKKTASKLLQDYDHIADIYDHIDEVKGPKLRANLLEHKDQVQLSYELVTIDTAAPIDFTLEEMKRDAPDIQRLVEIYEELEFRSRLKKLQKEQGIVPKVGTGPMSLFDTPVMEQPEAVVESSFSSIQQEEKEYMLVETPEEVSALVRKLERADTFAFDTETDGLGAMSCGIVGISFSTRKHEGYYLPLSELHAEAEEQLKPFRALFADPNKLKVGQNLKFDLEVISRYGIEPVGPYWDTMIAHYIINPELRHGMDFLSETYLGYRPIPITELIGARGKGQKSMRDLAPDKVAPYAAEDADVTLQLYEALLPELKEKELEKLYYELEMPLMEVLMRMEQTGVKLDAKSLVEVMDELNKQLSDLEQRIYQSVGGMQFNINSPREVGVVLFEELALDAKPKKTKTGQYSTSEEVLEKISHRHPIVGMILEYRGLRKLINTYVEPLPGLVNSQTGRIHTTYNQTVTATGRLSSTDPNLQNIPVRDSNGREIRRSFTSLYPDRGDLFVSADYSQIELRLMAHFSEDPHLIEAFEKGADIHTLTAAKIYHLDEEEVTPELRRRAKTANFGIIYGISAFGLSNRLSIPRGEASDLIRGYFEAYEGVQEYMERAKEQARELGYVETLLGRRRYLPDINSKNAVVRGYAERNAINTPLQGSAADIIKLAMLRIDQRLRTEQMRSQMFMQVHDELNFSVPKDELEPLMKLVEEEMEGVCPELRVPLVVDVGWGDNWLEAH
ncbi:MAG: DNA polymerase I [Porphyromonas sp.]|nr:DNA polymerase I [Porphyromonas sp.]